MSAAWALLLLADPAGAAEWLDVSARLELPSPPAAADAGALVPAPQLAPEQPDLEVGAPFHLVIEARHPPGGVALLAESIDLGEAFGERRSARSHQRDRSEGAEIDRYRLELVAFEAGLHQLPSVPLAFGSTQAATAPIDVLVGSNLAGDAAIVAAATVAEAIAELEKFAAQNPAPQAIYVPDRRPLWIAAGLVALALAAFAALALRRRLAARPAFVPPPPPPRPAHLVALERLDALAKRQLLEAGEHKAFHVELSEILRAWAGARYGFDSVELTVAELMTELEERVPEGLDRPGLRRILETSDWVKFAKLEIAAEESRALLGSAAAIVEATAPRAAAEAGAAPEGAP
jgi:hypothetical protein